MPDLVLFAQAFLVSALLAGLLPLALAHFGTKRNTRCDRAISVLSLAVGIFAGEFLLGLGPRWPALEDRDRLLLVLLPLAVFVEVLSDGRTPGTRLALRFALSAFAAPTLLFRSVYLSDLSGPGSAQWSPAERVTILLSLALLLAGGWTLGERLCSRTSAATIATVAVSTLLAAGVTVMLSGYYRGGLLALPWAAAVAGSALAWHRAGLNPRHWSGMGLAAMGTFSVLLIGRYFGALPTGAALLLWLVPWFAWGAEIPGIKRLGPKARGGIRLACVIVPLLGIVYWAQAQFARDFSARSNLPASSRPNP